MVVLEWMAKLKNSSAGRKTYAMGAVMILSFLLLANFAHGQIPTGILVPYDTARFQWAWAVGAPPHDGNATEFHVKCGTLSGVYTISHTVIGGDVRTAFVKDVLPQVGAYFCTVVAAAQFTDSAGAVSTQESPPSNEVAFSAARVPGPAAGFSVVIP